MGWGCVGKHPRVGAFVRWVGLGQAAGTGGGLGLPRAAVQYLRGRYLLCCEWFETSGTVRTVPNIVGHISKGYITVPTVPYVSGVCVGWTKNCTVPYVSFPAREGASRCIGDERTVPQADTCQSERTWAAAGRGMMGRAPRV